MGHHHDHHDHHDHHHDMGHEGEALSAAKKLSTLFDHWIRHNESHGQTYLQWAERARQEGLSDVSETLLEIARLTEKITEKLRSGAEMIGR